MTYETTDTRSDTTRRRLSALALIPVVIGIGLACKRYSGPGSDWVNNWGPASVAYEWLLMLLVFVVVPKREAIVKIAVGVFIATCLLEFLQLCKPDWLQELRSFLIGRLILGTTFSWWDFPAYLVGCVTGIYILRALTRTSEGGAT